MPKTTKKTKTMAKTMPKETKNALKLKKGTTVTYTVSRGNTGETMKKKATVVGHVPAETSLTSVLGKLPKKMVANLTPGAIKKIGKERSNNNRYLVFSSDTNSFACPVASKLNLSA
jgi:hypothetical protein